MHTTTDPYTYSLCNLILVGKTIDERCEAELSEYRRMLSEDYELSPEIVKGCATEITNNCNGGIKKHGETIHCLMALAKKPEFSSTCETAVSII